MSTNKLIIIGILGVALSIVVMFSFAIFVAPTLHQQNLTEYKSTDLAKQFQLTYPESGMVAISGTL